VPELPEVETVRRGLDPVLTGRRLTRVEARRPDLRRPLPRGFARRLRGARVLGVDRRAKYLLVRLDGGLVLMAHLGMSGSFRVFDHPPPPPGPHDHVIFETDAGKTVYFHDPRRFGLMDLVAESRLARHPLLAGLGPEPLDRALDGPALAVRLAGRRTSVKAALMDQGVIAGLGNIYVSEILFRAGISPRRLATNVKGARAERLVRAVRAVLADAIAAGGSSLRDHRAPDGELGYFQHDFAVYGRAGEPCPGCRCDVAATGGIRQLVQGGRATFYCPYRQR
jgi:formamidopyrimidine-DNA glycosylase